MKFLLPVVIGSALAAYDILDHGDADKGREMYQKQCAVCHSVEEGKNGHKAPSLFGVVGRKAGTARDYGIYSDAIREDGRIWTKEALNAYLADPKAAIPGNFMKSSGIADQYERADMIAFLKELAP